MTSNPTCKDVVYAPGLALDLYLPAAKPSGTVVFVHGGGWTRGDKAIARYLAPAMTNAGFAVASVNYTLAPPGALEQAANDVARAIVFLQRRATALGISPRLSLVGHSAGAFYAALVALDDEYLRAAGGDAGALQSVALLDCVGCDLPAEMRRPRGIKRADIFGRDPARWQALSPIAYVRPDQPPLWIGYMDKPGASKVDAEQFCAAVTRVGSKVSCDGFAEVSHGQFVTQLSQPSSPVRTPLVSFLRNE